MNDSDARAEPCDGAPRCAAVAKPRSSLGRNATWALLGNFAYGGCQWAMLIVIAKLGDPEMVGAFALAFAVTAPPIMFANLNLRGIQATDARREFEFGDFFTLRILSLVAANGVIALVALLMPYETQTRAVVGLVALAKTVESFSDLLFGKLQHHEDMERISKSLTLKGIASVLALAVGLYAGRSIVWGVAGLSVAWVAVLLAYDIPAVVRIAAAEGGARSLRPEWRPHVLARLAWFALPLGIATLMASLQTNVPRYFVERALGTRELGFFAAMAYATIAGARVVTAVGEAASPRLARHYAHGMAPEYSRLVRRIVAVGALAGVGAVGVAYAFGRPILTLLYRAEYGERDSLFVLVVAAAAVGYVALFLQYAMTAARVFRAQPVVLAISLSVLVISCGGLVGPWGARGAAVGMLIAAVVQLSGNGIATAAAIARLDGGRR